MNISYVLKIYFYYKEGKTHVNYVYPREFVKEATTQYTIKRDIGEKTKVLMILFYVENSKKLAKKKINV